MTTRTHAHRRAPTRTRRNPADLRALMRDAARQLDPSTGDWELWRERFDAAREVGVEDVQVELIEGLRDFGQQFQQALLAARPTWRPTVADTQAIQAWLATAPATFRLDGPLARGDRHAAERETTANYAQLLVTLFPPVPPRALSHQAWRRTVQEFWKRVLAWTAQRLDRGVAQIAQVLWDFDPFQRSLTRARRRRGAQQLHDELITKILESFPVTPTGGASAAGVGL